MTLHCVIGLDSSTQSTKAIAWNKSGDAVAEGRAAIPMDNPKLDHYEQDPIDWWSAAVIAINSCLEALPEDMIVDGLAISNQRETIGFIGADLEAVRPSIVWLDERARDEVAEFCNTMDGDTIHRITGRPPDVTPCLYTLSWMKKNAADVYQRTACFVDVQAYLVQKLCGGEFRTGWISADPFGLYDLENKCWSAPILEKLGITAERLPTTIAPGELLGEINATAAGQTGLTEGLPVYAAGGDGQCAGLGTNCTVADRAYINFGTALVSGVWSPVYRYNRAWRTELAAQGHGYIYETCLRSGAFLLNWFVEQFGLDINDPTVFEQLEKQAMQLPIGCDGLMVQPYWSGVMDPYWDSTARGVLIGLGVSHTRAHIYRAILEGIVLNQAMATVDMQAAANQQISHFVAIGGGAKSILWRQMLADATGKRVVISSTVEASALGAGMIAAFGVGWYSSIEEAAAAMSQVELTVEPDPRTAAQYAALLSIYRDIYQSTTAINQRLVAFAASQTLANSRMQHE